MKRDIWIFLFILGLLLFCWPFLTIFRDSMASYLFAAWAAFIVLMYLATVYEDRGNGGG
jgi:uncharacterized membrane protein